MIDFGNNAREFTHHYKIIIENEISTEEILALLNKYTYQALVQFNPEKVGTLGYSSHYFFQEKVEKGTYSLECDIIDFTIQKTAIEAYLYNNTHSKIYVKLFSVYENVKDNNNT